jgi:AcrR family transcriptional regulator
VPRVGLTPARLTEAGAAMADEVGFEAVTLSALARRFEVQVASLYAHVPGSAELRNRIAVLALDEIADRAEAGLAGRSGREALQALGDAYRSYAREHPGRYAAATYPLDGSDESLRVGGRHAELSRAALRGYRLGRTDEVHAVRLVGATVRGFVDLEVRGSFAHSRPSAGASWTRALDALDLALRHQFA